MPLSNDFSWSFSRANTFSECQKRYWYTYYGSWEGWPKTPWDDRKAIDPLASYLYAMKQMQSFPTFVGSCVHETIEHFLKTKKPFSQEALLAHAEASFVRGLEEAKNGIWRSSPKKYTNLFEYYYKQNPTAEQIQAAKDKIALSLKHWYESPVVQQLAFHPDSRWLGIEELSSFQLKNKFKIIVVIDFALMWRDTAILFDWKTGEESEKTEQQLYCYALFANRVWKVPYDKIILSPFYVAKNSYTKIRVGNDQEKFAKLEEDIASSCEALSALHTVTDPCQFAYTADRKSCSRCPFKELCHGAGYESATRDELREIVTNAAPLEI